MLAKYKKYKISFEDLKVKILNLNTREWAADCRELGETHIQKGIDYKQWTVAISERSI